MSIKYKVIGIIKTPFLLREGMPVQSKGAKGVKGTVEVKKRFMEGLKDLDEFSHIILVYHLHKSKGFNLQVIPFLDNKPHGIFATRAPKRPNPIGISVVKLLSITNNVLEVENVDIIDSTPLLDIKPYTPKFDHFETEKNGWIDNASAKVKEMKSDNRFQ